MRITTKVLYLDLMKRCLMNQIYGGDINLLAKEYVLNPESGKYVTVNPAAYTPDQKLQGGIWPSIAHTMIGRYRLDNLQFCIESVLRLWQEVPMVRGNEVHVGLRENLPVGTKTIDRIAIKDGIAESIKSIDPRLDSYREPSDLRNKLNDYVKKLEEYEGQVRNRGGFKLDEEEIQQKVLHFGIPDRALSPEQVRVFEDVGREVLRYNANLPVDKAPIKIKVTVLK